MAVDGPLALLGRRDVNIPAPLTIGVLSDTHVFDRGQRALPPQVPPLFARFGVGLIVHAGDVCAASLLARLEAIAPVVAVHGNTDPLDLRRALPERIDLDIGGRRLIVVHGHGGRTADRAAAALAGTADLVIYGHSHIPRLAMEQGTILFNPGSPTDRRWHPHFGIGIVTVEAGTIEPELILFDNPADLDRIEPSAGRTR